LGCFDIPDILSLSRNSKIKKEKKLKDCYRYKKYEIYKTIYRNTIFQEAIVCK